MNATELFLNMPAADNGPAGLGNLLNAKPAEKQAGQSMFRATFQKVLQVDHSRPAANGIKNADRNANPPIDNANFTQKIKQSDSPERQTTTTAAPVTGRAAYRDSSPTSKTPQNETPNQDQSPSNDNISSQSDVTASDAQASQSADQAGAQTQATASVDQKNADATEAATIALDDAAKADAQQMELLLSLLAMLLQMRADGNNAALTGDAKVAGDAAAPLDGLQLSFTVDKDSELYKQLSQLLNNVEGMSPELRDQMKLLVQVSDDKAIQISVSDLLGKLEARAGQDAGKEAISLIASPDGETAEFTLKLGSDEISKAQLVDLTAKAAPAQALDVVAKQPQIALLVPAELLAAHTAGVEAEKQQQAQAARIGLESQPAVVEAGKAAVEKAAEVVIPLSATAQMAKPKMTTTDSKFQQSDEFLKRLDVKALAKELSAAAEPKAEIASRFERLFSSSKPGDTFNPVILNGKGAGYEFVKGFANFNELKNQGGSDAQKQADWMKDQLRADMNPDRFAMASKAADMTSAERIGFLGRTEGSATTTFQHAVEQAAEARAPQQSAEVYQNVLDQVTSRIQLSQMSAAGGEMRIFLRPEHLGDLHIKIRVDQDVVVAKFVAHSQEVKAILESSMNQLRDSLAEAGIKAGKIVVTLENNGQNHQPAADSGRQAPNGRSGYTDASAPAVEELTAANGEYLPMNDEVIYGTRTLGAAASRFSYFA